MDWQYTLVKTYVFVCEGFKEELYIAAARMSNNDQPSFTDEELITIYLFGIMQGHFQMKAIYNYTRNHLGAWFPGLPSYQAFVNRLGRLGAVFMMLTERILSFADTRGVDHSTKLVDSFPVVMALGKRGDHAKVALELADKGKCASKGIFYHGVKVHVVAKRHRGRLPLPEAIGLSKASEHDLTALRSFLSGMRQCQLFGDKIYYDQPLKKQLKADQAVELHTPIRRKKGQAYLRSDQELYGTLVSRIRQPIESLFNWIQEKTNIERASKVRSANGLLVHVFGKIAAAMFILVFNP